MMLLLSSSEIFCFSFNAQISPSPFLLISIPISIHKVHQYVVKAAYQTSLRTFSPKDVKKIMLKNCMTDDIYVTTRARYGRRRCK